MLTKYAIAGQPLYIGRGEYTTLPSGKVNSTLEIGMIGMYSGDEYTLSDGTSAVGVLSQIEKTTGVLVNKGIVPVLTGDTTIAPGSTVYVGADGLATATVGDIILGTAYVNTDFEGAVLTNAVQSVWGGSEEISSVNPPSNTGVFVNLDIREAVQPTTPAPAPMPTKKNKEATNAE